ncbi:ABC transporter ATP-binding protein [Niallia sp. 03133]|uniref:ABC transporter ATP-binding protein n=1 Tax=Niallia sp. 03133 TaxID=3458060 RepID=UPI004043C691
MLEINALKSGYGDITVLQGVNLSINEGEIVGLLGTNGAGKTTLLKTISGLIKAKEGTVTYLGENLLKIHPSKLLSMGIAHVPQGRHIFSKMTVSENLQIGLDGVKKRVEAKERLEYVVNLFPRLEERMNQFGGTLSGGEQQMLAVARALVTKPKLLILDEPSMGLAPIVTQKMFESIKQIAKDGTTIFLVEQNAVAALNIINRLYIMERGEIVYQSQQIDEKELDNVKEVYLGISS